MLKSIFYVPLDLGIKLDFEKIKKKGLISIDIVPLTRKEESIFRESVMKLSKPPYSIFIDNNGIGVSIFEKIDPDFKLCIESCADIMMYRKTTNWNIINGSDPLTQIIKDLKNEIAIITKQKTNPDAFGNALYVDALYCLQHDYKNDKIEVEIEKCLCAIFEPSAVGMGYSWEDKVVECEMNRDKLIQNINEIDLTDYSDLLKKSNEDNSLTIFSSWDGGFLFDKDFSKYEMPAIMYTYLEYSWSIASYIDIWSNKQIKQKAKLTSIEEVEVNFVSQLDELGEIINYSVPLRYQLIYKKIVELSMLKPQIEMARNSIRKLKQYGLFLRDASSKKVNLTIQLLLFTLALSQAIPLFFKTPIATIDTSVISILFIVAISLFLYSNRK